MSKHGLLIGLDRVGNAFFVSIKATGKLTHEDYERMVPILEAALVKVNEPRVKVLFDATEFEGWELRAAWDDFKLGITHGPSFDKIAIYGKHEWQDLAAKVGSWFVHGDIRSFTSHDDAVNWLIS